MNTKPLSRKEIGQLVGVCAKTVKRNELAWGLDKARAKTGNRIVLFTYSKALSILLERGLVESGNCQFQLQVSPGTGSSR